MTTQNRFASRFERLTRDDESRLQPVGDGDVGSRPRMVVPTSTGKLVLDVNEITWISANDYYAELHARGRRYLLRQSLTSIQARLEPFGFVRVHRSAIVNMAYFREFRLAGDGGIAILRDGTSIPISRRCREVVASELRRIDRTLEARRRGCDPWRLSAPAPDPRSE